MVNLESGANVIKPTYPDTSVLAAATGAAMQISFTKCMLLKRKQEGQSLPEQFLIMCNDLLMATSGTAMMMQLVTRPFKS